MQLYGEKEYVAFSPEQGAVLYPRPGIERNKSQINDPLNPDLDAFPLCDQAEGVRFRLGPGETLFVPAGWWHTARILSPSVTVSINTVNRANAAAFRHDDSRAWREALACGAGWPGRPCSSGRQHGSSRGSDPSSSKVYTGAPACE